MLSSKSVDEEELSQISKVPLKPCLFLSKRAYLSACLEGPRGGEQGGGRDFREQLDVDDERVADELEELGELDDQAELLWSESLDSLVSLDWLSKLLTRGRPLS